MRWLFRFVVGLTLIFIIIAAPRMAWTQSEALVDPPTINIPDDLRARIAVKVYDDAPRTWITQSAEYIPVAQTFTWNTEDFEFEWSPDCERYAFSAVAPEDAQETNSQRVWVGDYASDAPPIAVSPLDPNSAAFILRWSPRGTAISYHNIGDEGPEVHVAFLSTGESWLVGRGILSAGWFSEHELLVYSLTESTGNSMNKDFFVATLTNGSASLEFIPGEYYFGYPDSAHGRRFAAAVNNPDTGVQALNLYTTDGRLIRTLATSVSPGVYWSSDGQSLTYQQPQGGTFVVDVDTRHTTQIDLNPPLQPIIGWSRDHSKDVNFQYDLRFSNDHLIYRFFASRENVLQQGVATYNLETGVTETLISIDPTDPGYYDFRVCIP